MKRILTTTALIALATAAVAPETASARSSRTPRSEGERASGFSYVPFDPLPVRADAGYDCPRGSDGMPDTSRQVPLLNVLPDNAVRIAIRQLSASASLGFGPAQLGVEGNSYQVILDYINADVSNIRFVYTADRDDARNLSLSTLGRDWNIVRLRRVRYSLESVPLAANEGEFVIPVYVGVGLRLTANVQVRRGRVNLASLGALSAAAQAERLTGSLIVQTLGITGRQVTSSLPLPSELNPTTVQNAILSMGAIKAIVYDRNDTIVTPRVTGIYNPLPGGDERIINMIVSELAREPIPWIRNCTNVS